MKKGKRPIINIHLTNRWLYSLIVLGIILIIGVGIYAATYSASGAGHPYTEISTCGANQILRMNSGGTSWTCVDMPTTPPIPTGLYGNGWQYVGISSTCYTFSSPVYQGANGCACPAGYTLVITAQEAEYNSYRYYSCYKN